MMARSWSPYSVGLLGEGLAGETSPEKTTPTEAADFTRSGNGTRGCRPAPAGTGSGSPRVGVVVLPVQFLEGGLVPLVHQEILRWAKDPWLDLCRASNSPHSSRVTGSSVMRSSASWPKVWMRMCSARSTFAFCPSTRSGNREPPW